MPPWISDTLVAQPKKHGGFVREKLPADTLQTQIERERPGNKKVKQTQ
jgi:hypothetical protein